MIRITQFISFLTRMSICVCFLLVFSTVNAQEAIENSPKSEFWGKVKIGGGLGVGIGNGYTDIAVAPSAIYQANQFVAMGLGVQYSYVKQKNFYNSHIYGVSLIGLFNPIEFIQVSAELEQLRVNNRYNQNIVLNQNENFWNTALFLGAGYHSQNVTVGLRYNVLHSDRNNVYGDALMPFIRVYF